MTEGRFFEGVREEGGGGGVHAGGSAAVEFGADGVEVDEPALKEGSGSGLEGGIHTSVQLDLVIQCPQHLGNPLLLRQGWEADMECLRLGVINRLMGRSTGKAPQCLVFRKQNILQIVRFNVRTTHPIHEVLARSHLTSHNDDKTDRGSTRKTDCVFR